MYKFLFITALFFFLGTVNLNAQLPERPKDNDFIQDNAFVINQSDAEQIRAIQAEIFKSYGTPIVVVTIESMNSYNVSARNIEGFAFELFNDWGIGSQENNSGILLLVSVNDRKARIELGKSWGLRWNGYAKEIMDNEIIPSFKRKLYSKGIINGVKALADMASLTPTGQIPKASILEKAQNFTRKQVDSHMLKKKIGSKLLYLMLFLGIGLIIASFFVEESHRKKVLIAGISLVVFVVLLKIVLIILALIFRGKGGHGGFGGGSSGGGGASGGW